MCLNASIEFPLRTRKRRFLFGIHLITFYKDFWSYNFFRKLIKEYQIIHYTRFITPKRVTSLRGPFTRHCARATQLLSKKCRMGGEQLAALCPIWPDRGLNFRPPAPETNVLPLDQLWNKEYPKIF